MVLEVVVAVVVITSKRKTQAVGQTEDTNSWSKGRRCRSKGRRCWSNGRRGLLVKRKTQAVGQTEDTSSWCKRKTRAAGQKEDAVGQKEDAVGQTEDGGCLSNGRHKLLVKRKTRAAGQTEDTSCWSNGRHELLVKMEIDNAIMVQPGVAVPSCLSSSTAGINGSILVRGRFYL